MCTYVITISFEHGTLVHVMEQPKDTNECHGNACTDNSVVLIP